MNSIINEQMKRFNLLSSEIDAAYHEAAFRLGLSDSTMLVLYTVFCNHGECLLNDITLMSGARKQTINSALRKMEKEGLVYLKSSEKRKKRVCLTEKGRQLGGDTVSKIIQMENEIFSSWSDEEISLYIELTGRYLDAFKEKIKEL